MITLIAFAPENDYNYTFIAPQTARTAQINSMKQISIN